MDELETIGREIAEAEAILGEMLIGTDADVEWARRWVTDYLRLRRAKLARLQEACSEGT